MKKLISLILALMLVLTCAALAEENADALHAGTQPVVGFTGMGKSAARGPG